MRNMVAVMALMAMLSGCSSERGRASLQGQSLPSPEESLASYRLELEGDKDGTSLLLKKRPKPPQAFDYDNSLNRPTRASGWAWKTLRR